MPFRIFVAAGWICLSIFSCTSQDETPPPGVLSEIEMVPVLVDVHLLEGMIDQFRIQKLPEGNDAIRHEYALIFEKHHISPGVFDTSFDYHVEHPEKMNRILEEVLDELNRMR